MSWVFVDCEASGPAPCVGRLTWFSAVEWASSATFDGLIVPSRARCANPAISEEVEPPMTDAVYDRCARVVFKRFRAWLAAHAPGRPVMWSDNPAYDYQWINDGFWRYLGENPFGHSARRISDFYAGVVRDPKQTQKWKQWRVTRHDHNPVHDALGNVEAMRTLFEKMRSGEL